MSIFPDSEPNGPNELASLRAECAMLRHRLEETEIECAFFRNGFYEYERQYGEFANADIDIDELKRTPAGPVELL